MSNKKSFIAKIEEIILRFTKPDYMDSRAKIDEFLAKKPNQNPPGGIFKSIEIENVQVYAFGRENAEHTILFIHGGAYVNEINYQHLLYCFLLARKLDVYVLAPVYPLAPLHKAAETYEMITPLYQKLIQTHNLILMGDSAGGGFFIHSANI